MRPSGGTTGGTPTVHGCPDRDTLRPVRFFGIYMSMTTETVETTATDEVKEPGTPSALGDVVKGDVIAVDRSTVFIDLSPFGTGIIYGREFSVAKDVLRKVRIGDTISAKIIETETEDGYIDLSLKEARNTYIWSEADAAIRDKRVYHVIIKNANRGGLVIEWNGVRGFLPASQLSEEHYPKTLNGDKDVVLNELKKFIGKELSVIIESADPANDALIFSEQKNRNGGTEKDGVTYKVGDVENGIVTGVVDFGVFVTINNNIEGLVHISEMDWGLVDDPRKFYSVGNPVQVKIIEIEDKKYSFSFKELRKNPWKDILDRHKVGDTVSGVIIKYGTFGAFASIEAGVSGLVHISNFKNGDDLRNSLEIGKTYKFVIKNLEPEEQKLTIIPEDRYRAVQEKREKAEKREETAAE